MIRKGIVKNSQQAFKKYLAKDQPAYVDKRTLTSQEAFEMIADAGGISSLAHPKQLKLDQDPKRFESEIERFRAEGLKGIEVYSSCQSQKEAKRYREAAQRFGLVVTGGSDFHGGNKPDVTLGCMGDGASIPYETIDQMKQMILERKLK